MDLARRHRAFGATGGWWRATVRALALVLCVALALPAAGLAFHDGHRAGEPSAAWISGDRIGIADVAEAAPRVTDPGLACHTHCGCHLAASPCEADVSLPPAPARPRFGRTRETATSVFPDRLPRPPRA